MTVLNYRVKAAEKNVEEAVSASVDRYPWDRFLANSKVPQGQTDELLTWISKVNQKKNFVSRQKDKNLRKEALLNSAKLNAVDTLHSMQFERRRRWNEFKARQKCISEEDTSICDCEDCFLCLRHNGALHGKCYCNVIFSPRPFFMELKHKTEIQDEHSKTIDNFLSSLSSDNSNSLKRKRSDTFLPSKRCKA